MVSLKYLLDVQLEFYQVWNSREKSGGDRNLKSSAYR